MPIADHIRRVLAAGADISAIELDGEVLSWAALDDALEAIDSMLSTANIGRDSVVGLLGRNRLEQVGGFIAALGADRGVVLINAIRPTRLIAEEVAELQLPCLLGSADDLSQEVVAAARTAGTMVVEMSASGGRLTFRRIAAIGAGPHRRRTSGTMIEIQTSGTTGKPKRIPIAEHTLEASLKDGVRTVMGAVEQSDLKPKSSPTLMFGPLVHTSGTFNTLMSVFEVRPIVLFEKFDAEKYRRALIRYRPKFVPLPPTAIKMLLDSEAGPEDFSSVLAVRAGTAALPVELQVAFEQKFGVPVLTTYGATEFMGVATSWTVDDHRQFFPAKLGSVGRASKGVQIRVVDPASGAELSSNAEGVLEAKFDRLDGGRKWVRTTDLARIDEDGFLFILGRADEAIIRGGFKVMGTKVADVLIRCPGVCDAIVLGRPDDRLGEIPVAVIEPKPGAAIDVQTLRAFAKKNLVGYEVPARFHIVDALPRTVSDKISRPAVKAMLDDLEAGALPSS